MKNKANRFLAGLYDVAEVAITALVIATLLYVAGFRQAQVVGDSMQNTLQSGQRLLLNNFFYEPSRGDIVVINRYHAEKTYSALDLELGRDEPLIKRVIAVGGDTVQVESDAVYVNGKRLDEPYVYSSQNMLQPNDPYGMTVEVPEGYLFVMGDHRDESLDSRWSEVGLIKTSDVMGKAVWRLTPFGSIE